MFAFVLCVCVLTRVFVSMYVYAAFTHVMFLSTHPSLCSSDRSPLCGHPSRVHGQADRPVLRQHHSKCLNQGQRATPFGDTAPQASGLPRHLRSEGTEGRTKRKGEGILQEPPGHGSQWSRVVHRRIRTDQTNGDSQEVRGDTGTHKKYRPDLNPTPSLIPWFYINTTVFTLNLIFEVILNY